MSVATTKRELTCKDTGIKGTIADCPFARLKYYLSCVDGVLDVSEKAKIPMKFKTGFDKVCMLTTSESDELIRLARRWHPDIMVKRGAFGLDNERKFCIKSSNNFTEMTLKEMKVDPANQIFTETTRTLTVMHFTSIWARSNFHNPCEQAEQALISKRIDEFTLERKNVERNDLKDQKNELDDFFALIPK
jgi:hypothetical protein